MIDTATRTALLTFLPFLLLAKGLTVAGMGVALAVLFAGGAAGKFVCGLVAERVGIVRTVILTELATACGIVAVALGPLGVALGVLLPLGVALNGVVALYATVAGLVLPRAPRPRLQPLLHARRERIGGGPPALRRARRRDGDPGHAPRHVGGGPPDGTALPRPQGRSWPLEDARLPRQRAPGPDAGRGMKGVRGLGLALLRVTLGVIFLMHGYLGFDIGPDGIAGYTTRMGYPASLGRALGWYLIAAHSLDDILLIVGFLTRWPRLPRCRSWRPRSSSTISARGSF